GGRGSIRLQWMPPQVHPVPASETTDSPGGGISSTVSGPMVGCDPTLETVTLYCALVCPCEKLPLWVLVTARTGGPGRTLVGSFAVCSVPSPPPVAVAWLVSGEDALTATFTVIVISGQDAPGASAS